MTSLAPSNAYLRLRLLGPCATVALAAPTLASYLGITLAEATVRLSRPPTTLSHRVETHQARRLATLLVALGVPVHLEPVEQGAMPSAPPGGFELSLQPFEAKDIVGLANTISQALPPLALGHEARKPLSLKKALAGPGGLVLTGLSAEDVHRLRRAFRKIDRLRLATSGTHGALYDILPDPRLPGPRPDNLAPSLRKLGLVPCVLTGAIASRLDAPTRDHVLRRFADMGLIALNHDFQRFDLFLTGIQNLSPRDLADFLLVRSDLPRKVLERMPRALRIESGLTRANASAFQADYAALGLETCARLRLYHPLQADLPNRVTH
jgi:hypothetical protein